MCSPKRRYKKKCRECDRDYILAVESSSINNYMWLLKDPRLAKVFDISLIECMAHHFQHDTYECTNEWAVELDRTKEKLV